jgi:alkylation response protein AidB-like acyl-CoA dehydrogenase
VGGDVEAEAPIYRIPFMPMFTVGFGAIAVGAVQRIADEVKQRVRDRQRVLYGVKEWESPIAQRNVAELLTRKDAIEALQERYVQQLEAWDKANTPVVSEVDRNRPNAWRSWMCREASQIAFRAMEMLGGAATTRGDVLEIYSRDLVMLLIHVGQLYDDNMLSYGRAEYGLSGHPLL